MENLSVELILWLQKTSGTVIEWFFQFISLLGEEYLFIVVLGTVYWAVNKRTAEYIGTALGISFSLNNVIKSLTQMPRPFERYPEVQNLRPGTSTGSSFPSGHTQGFGSFVFAIAYTLGKRKWWVIAGVLTVLMMISRMYLGVHYLSDVFVGAALGIMVALAHGVLFNRMYHDKVKLRRYYGVLIIVFFPFLFFVSNNDFFQGYGIMAGLIVAASLEKKYVGFSMQKPLRIKVLRVIIGIVLLVVTLTALKTLFGLFGFVEGTWSYNMLDFLRYFLLANVGFFLYPMVFKHLGY